MLNITGTVIELIYASTATGAEQNTFTSERTLFTTAEMGERPVIPPYYFAPTAGIGAGIKIYAAGILSTTSAPTFTWTIRLGSNGSTSACIGLGSAALTAATTVTSKGWELEGTIILRTLLTAGASSTIMGQGSVRGFESLASPFGGALFGGATQPGTATTFDPSITNYVNVNITCGTSSGSNKIQLMQLLVWGLR